jgi:hypothetical protein
MGRGNGLIGFPPPPHLIRPRMNEASKQIPTMASTMITQVCSLRQQSKGRGGHFFEEVSKQTVVELAATLVVVESGAVIAWKMEM